MKHYLYYEEIGKIQGIIGCFEVKENYNTQITFCIIQHGMKAALQKLLQHLTENRKTGSVYFAFPKANKETIQFVKANPIMLIEESWNHTFLFPAFQKRRLQEMCR